MLRIFVVLPLLALLAASCGTGGDGYVASPRRYAYPRPALPDTIMTSRGDSLPMSMQTNAAADVEVQSPSPGSTWVNVVYPGIDASVHYTFSEVDSPEQADRIIDNRIERMELNFGGEEIEETAFLSPAGLETHIYTARRGTTPVQFLATDSRSVVVSGVAWLRAADAATAQAADSLAPVIRFLADDIRRTLQSAGAPHD